MNSAAYRHGIELFNAGEFYEAHEVLEDVWRPLVGPERRFLQALIQIAVAMHHYGTGNLAGARSLLARGAAKLADCPDEFCGVRVAPLRRAVHAWQTSLSTNVPPLPPMPRLEVVGE